MSKAQEETNSRPTFSETDLANARAWFTRGQDLVGKKNYDYAIQCYINGLEYWPEAVEEGHMPCRAAALFRGPQKVGFADNMKYKTSGKDIKRAMLNAEVLLSKEPNNVAHMEALFKNASKAQYDATVMWIGKIFFDAAITEKKPNPNHFILMREVYEDLADRRMKDDPKLAMSALERAIDALDRLRTLRPQDMALGNEIRDLAGKLTILKGKYSEADSFRDSVRDADAQRELHDSDRVVQSDERMDELITQAQARYQSNPNDRMAVNNLVDLLVRREDDASEKKAIGILVKAYKETNEYRFKMRADDIYMRQLGRKLRQLQAQGDPEAYKQARRDKLRFELNVFKERSAKYPTDMRVKFHYGQRLFEGRLFDEAIPVLQEARSDPKTRFQCSLYVGRCFYEKQYYGAAIDVLKDAIENYELPEDELGKELHYWLGRSYEAEGKTPEALKMYGQLIQWDYNYRNGEVRKRIDDLRNKQ